MLRRYNSSSQSRICRFARPCTKGTRSCHRLPLLHGGYVGCILEDAVNSDESGVATLGDSIRGIVLFTRVCDLVISNILAIDVRKIGSKRHILFMSDFGICFGNWESHTATHTTFSSLTFNHCKHSPEQQVLSFWPPLTLEAC